MRLRLGEDEAVGEATQSTIQRFICTLALGSENNLLLFFTLAFSLSAEWRIHCSSVSFRAACVADGSTIRPLGPWVHDPHYSQWSSAS
ncbi:hypothetical protein M9X92_011005 [Pyricularia oryzae]|nr:hypothetical protein M9X92_011005 [Pyricularia oryzae]